jgi:uracil-DNA glycosylase
VSKCIKDCLTLEDVVWANVVKHRTPGDHVRNRPTAQAEQEHGIRQHLMAELKILRPIVVVAVGAPADYAMRTLNGNWKVMRIKAQGASDEEAFEIRDRIHAMGLFQRNAEREEGNKPTG